MPVNREQMLMKLWTNMNKERKKLSDKEYALTLKMFKIEKELYGMAVKRIENESRSRRGL